MQEKHHINKNIVEQFLKSYIVFSGFYFTRFPKCNLVIAQMRGTYVLVYLAGLTTYGKRGTIFTSGGENLRDPCSLKFFPAEFDYDGCFGVS